MPKISTKKSVLLAIERILRTVKYDDGFHFFTDIGQPTRTTATSLEQFVKELETIDVRSIIFHSERADFQKWITEILEDVELAHRLDKIPKGTVGEPLRKKMLEILKVRIAELVKYQNS